MRFEMALGNIMIDCMDDARLRDFYAELLGWKPCVLYGKPGVRSGSGVVLLFAREDDYAPPTWPEEPGMQQKQLHLDFQTDDIPGDVRRAERLGAKRARAKFGGDEFVTLLDPDGHPFCLCRKE